ncbi:MAG: molybdopterin molybdotransferase [Rubritalea sp.]|jgi:molybdopterin molybdotransferase
MQSLISTKEATDIIAKHLVPVGSEKVALDDAFGRVLASDILADRDAPPFDRVMMDGICINTYNHILGSWRYKIIGTQAAGADKMTLPKGEFAIEVMTGAPLPTDANCIIPVEKIDIQDGYALPHEGIDAEEFQHIHKQGTDGKAGDTLITPGTTLTANELAIAASVGATELEVTRLPNIHLITTGDEVIDTSQSPTDFQIRRSHPTAIRSLIESQHLGNISNEHVQDDPEMIEERLNTALTNSKLDVLILTGGISMGKFDWVAPLLNKLLGEPAFHGVSQRPGKPFAFWGGDKKNLRAGESDSDCKAPLRTNASECKPLLIFALPGNPVSVMATMHRYVLPALREILGKQKASKNLPLAEDFQWDSPLAGILPYKTHNGKITIHPPRNSGDYISLQGTDGFAEIPPHSELKAGEKIPLF